MKKHVYILFLLLFACQEKTERTQNEAFRTERQNRTIKRLTDSQIVEFAFEKGKEVGENLNRILLEKIGSNPKNFDCKNTFAIQIDSARFPYIQKASFICDPKTPMNDTEKQIWDAYQYNLNIRAANSENIQKIGKTELLYTLPLQINEQFLGMWSITLSRKELVKVL